MAKQFSPGIFIALVIVLAIFLHQSTNNTLEGPSADIRDFYVDRIKKDSDTYPSIKWDKSNYITNEEEAKIRSVVSAYMKEKNSYNLNRNIWLSAAKGAIRGAVLGALYEGAEGALIGGMTWFAVGGIMRALEAQ